MRNLSPIAIHAVYNPIMLMSVSPMPKLRVSLITTLLTSLLTSVITLTPHCAIASEAPIENSSAAIPTETIVLGRSAHHHYVVMIPVSSLTAPLTFSPQFKLLQKIRTIAPHAFLSSHYLGDYIYVGGFDRVGPAQQQLQRLAPHSSTVRIVYFP